MKRDTLRTLFLAMLTVVIGLAPARGDDETTFIRFRKGNGPTAGALEIAQATYRSADGSNEVILYGVVHIADAGYYAIVQKDLDSYDAVLYEGVKPDKNFKPDPKMAGIGDLQKTMGELLGLTFQKDGINYKAKNLVHADMTASELKKAAGGDISKALPGAGMFSGEMMKNIGPMLKMGAKFLKTMFDGNPQMRDSMKMRFAQQLGGKDAMAAMGGDVQRILIVERNKVAMKVLRRELKARKGQSLALFYGAAHLKDFHERLATMGYKQTSKSWKAAWTVGTGAEGQNPPAGAQAEATPAPKPKPSRTKKPAVEYYE